MIGINFNDNNKVVFKHYNPNSVEKSFDMKVESLPTKDETKSDMIATLYKDNNDNLYWEYTERPATEEERIADLEEALANQIGG